MEKIWTVASSRSTSGLATRTRVLPEDKAVTVGEPARTIQPANILVNAYRTASRHPFMRTQGTPDGCAVNRTAGSGDRWGD